MCLDTMDVCWTGFRGKERGRNRKTRVKREKGDI